MGDVFKLCTRVANAYSHVIRRSPVYICNPYIVPSYLRGLERKRFQSLYQPLGKGGQTKSFGQNLLSVESDRNVCSTNQAPSVVILTKSDNIWEQIPRSLRKDTTNQTKYCAIVGLSPSLKKRQEKCIGSGNTAFCTM